MQGAGAGQGAGRAWAWLVSADGAGWGKLGEGWDGCVVIDLGRQVAGCWVGRWQAALA